MELRWEGILENIFIGCIADWRRLEERPEWSNCLPSTGDKV